MEKCYSFLTRLAVGVSACWLCCSAWAGDFAMYNGTNLYSVSSGGVTSTITVTAAPSIDVGTSNNAVFASNGVVEIQANTNNLGRSASFSAGRTNSQAMTAGAGVVQQVLPLIEMTDTHDRYDPSTGVYVPSITGAWDVLAFAYVQSATAQVNLMIRHVSGVTTNTYFTTSNPNASGNTTISGAAVIPILTTNDTLSLWISNDASFTLFEDALSEIYLLFGGQSP